MSGFGYLQNVVHILNLVLSLYMNVHLDWQVGMCAVSHQPDFSPKSFTAAPIPQQPANTSQSFPLLWSGSRRVSGVCPIACVLGNSGSLAKGGRGRSGRASSRQSKGKEGEESEMGEGGDWALPALEAPSWGQEAAVAWALGGLGQQLMMARGAGVSQHVFLRSLSGSFNPWRSIQTSRFEGPEKGCEWGCQVPLVHGLFFLWVTQWHTVPSWGSSCPAALLSCELRGLGAAPPHQVIAACPHPWKAPAPSWPGLWGLLSIEEVGYLCFGGH